MAATINVNGRITDARDAVIPVLDHGFLYGEGIYETLRTYNRRPFLFDRHMRRLRNSARMIALEIPFSDEQCAGYIRDTTALATLGDNEAYIRVLVTRGVGDLTYDPSATPRPSYVVIVKPHIDLEPSVYEQGVQVAIVDVVRNHPDSVNPIIKSNNLLNNALAMQEAIRRGGFEGVMRNYRGELSECTTANLFIVRRALTLTPPLSAGFLPGITREFVLEIAKAVGVDAREEVLRDQDLFDADEAFLTSTTREVVPIVRVDDRTIGNGMPGPVTLRLLEEYRRRARGALVPEGGP